MSSCNQIDIANSKFQFNYCPSLAAAALFTALFAVTTAGHVFQAIQYRKSFCWVLIMGGTWEFIGSLTRIISIQNPFQQPVSNASFIFILLAPLWINAFDYVVLGRLVYYYMPDQQIARVRARRMAVYFVTLDITCFLVQLMGGLLTLKKGDDNVITTGLHVYTAGVCLQEFVILVFLGLSVFFWRRLFKESPRTTIRQARNVMIVMYVSLVLITYRIAFRIAEFATGVHSQTHFTISDNEWFLYVFDTAPMFLALLVFHIYHPGRALQGPEADYPKLTRSEKRAAKEERKRIKQEKRRAKKEGIDLSEMTTDMERGIGIEG